MAKEITKKESKAGENTFLVKAKEWVKANRMCLTAFFFADFIFADFVYKQRRFSVRNTSLYAYGFLPSVCSLYEGIYTKNPGRTKSVFCF